MGLLGNKGNLANYSENGLNILWNVYCHVTKQFCSHLWEINKSLSEKYFSNFEFLHVQTTKSKLNFLSIVVVFFRFFVFFSRKFHHVLDKWYSPLWISEFMTFQGNSFTPSCNIDKKVQYKAGKSIFQHWTTFLRPLAWCKPGMMQASYRLIIMRSS